MSKKKITRSYRRLAREHILESPHIIARQLDVVERIEKLLAEIKESEVPQDPSQQEASTSSHPSLERRGG